MEDNKETMEQKKQTIEKKIETTEEIKEWTENFKNRIDPSLDGPRDPYHGFLQSMTFTSEKKDDEMGLIDVFQDA